MLAVSFTLIAVGFLCVFGDLIHSLTTKRWFPLLHIVTDFLMFSVVLVYAVHGYKKPHGNSLKISFLLFGLYLVACSLIPNPPDEIIENRAYLDTVVDAGTGIATIPAAYSGMYRSPWESFSRPTRWRHPTITILPAVIAPTEDKTKGSAYGRPFLCLRTLDNLQNKLPGN